MTRKKVAKIVLDTNLLVAAYFNPRSASATIIERCLNDSSFQTLYTKGMRREANLILRNIRASKSYRERVGRVFELGKRVDKIEKHMLIKDDPEDNKFLDCAISARADYIVTNDEHMLKLSRIPKLSIVKPTEFMRIIRKKLAF